MRRLAAASAAIVGLLVMAASPAWAKPGTTIDPAARSAAEAAITARLADLNSRVTLVNQSPALSASDRDALQGELNTTVSGLSTLATTIANETSQAAFRAEAAEIYANFRVYALVLPQVHLVRATDELSGVVVPSLQRLQQALQARVTAEQQQGKDVSATVSPMNDLAHQITAIQADTTGLSVTLLAVTPARWNADHTILSGPRQQLGSARTAAGQALDDVRSVRAAIQ